MRRIKLKFSEEALIRAIREKHPNGARALYDMYSGSLHSIIFRILNNETLSEDVLQDTFIRIWNSFEGYDNSKGRLFTWMVHIARHMAIDQIRSKAFRNTQRTQELDSRALDIAEVDHADRRLDRKSVLQAISCLRITERQVLDLVYFKGFTHVEAAQMLNIPLGTVKTRLLTGIKRLREYYGPEIANAS